MAKKNGMFARSLRVYVVTISRTGYKFTRNVYDKFLPIHVKRVKSAVIQLPDPKDFFVKSLTSIASAENDPELPDSQETAPSSQVTGSQKRQKLPPKVILQQENNRQRHEIDQLRREKGEQKQEVDKQKDLVDQLMGQIDLLLRQQTQLLSQIERGSNASKLQSSGASGLSQVFKD